MSLDNARLLLGLWSVCLFPSQVLAAGQLLQLSHENQPCAPRLPAVGDRWAYLLAPDLLELDLVTASDLGRWNFVTKEGQVRLPAPGQFHVVANGRAVPVTEVGFKRRALYAPLKARDLRVASSIFLKLGEGIATNQQVVIKNASLWSDQDPYSVRADPLRWSPAVHVNQTGYMLKQQKIGLVGYYAGSLGELSLPGAAPQPGATGMFQVLEAHTHKVAFEGRLKRRGDQGFSFACYQQVFEADFTPLAAAGEFVLYVPGLGTSAAFAVDDAVIGAFTRAYALGLYHQRCGSANALPYTRFTHGPCHTGAAEIPDESAKFKSANESLAKESGNFKDNPRHTAPQLKSINASLYPFVRRGAVDVSGGHHDAGDYSKYTINSAAFVHHLVFAADAFPGVAQLDNLGLPESGDGKSDVLQEAKWETDFLAKMQDDDGGFYFLVYPREREYENDVTPDHGDPQVVFPKTTSATAAAVAALAQCASSPTFKKQFPKEAQAYLAAARKGWEFLERAIKKYGKDGAYQKITHYGDEFMHDDELAWAACELFLATGEPAFHKRVQEWLNPADPGTRRWGWWRLYEAYGCAIRSYAFGARTGRVSNAQLSPWLLEGCENEIVALGDEQMRRANDSAYGTSFPLETKRAQGAGWYFSDDAGFDLAVACQVQYPPLKDPRPGLRAALVSNLNYEQGCNPVNVCYLTGLGWKRQREIVHQYAQNDRRVLPLTGIPLGNIQAGIGWNYVYEKEPDALSFPSDGNQTDPYPFYDRWADAFNLTQEFVILNQARALGCLCWLMAETPLKNQAWKPAHAQINRTREKEGYRYDLACKELDLTSARIVWEAAGREPVYGLSLTNAGLSRLDWVEAEAQLPDGRRVFGVFEPK